MRITKKITSIVLAVLMVVSMMSVMAISASALTGDDVQSLMNSMHAVISGYLEQHDSEHAEPLINYYNSLGQAFSDANGEVTPEVESKYNAAYEYFMANGGAGVSYPDVNNVYRATNDPVEVTVSNLQPGDVLVTSSAPLEVEKGNCNIVLVGGTYGMGEDGDLYQTYPSNVTLGNELIFEFNDNNARIVDLGENHGRYDPVYNNALGNAYMVLGNENGTVYLAGYNYTTYTITWNDWDGSNLYDGQSTVAPGTVPYYRWSVSRNSTAQYSYTFTGWTDSSKTFYAKDSDLPAASKDETYTATYSQTLRSYTITWKDGNNNTLKSDSVAYGATPSYTGATPTKTEDEDYTYEFNNTWSPSVASVTGNATYTAQFTAVPKSAPATPKVAEVNGTQYETLAEAVAAAPAGATVKLLENVTLTESLVIPAEKDFTLDLNGKDITGNVNDKLVKNNGTVVVDDSTAAPGHIYNTNIDKQGNAAFVNYGTATVKNGYFGDKNSDMTDANAVNRGAGFQNQGTAVIDGGYFTACDNFTNTAGTGNGYAYAIINYGNITINDATVYGKNNGNLANDEGTMVVNGGTYTLNKPKKNVYYSIYNGSADANTTVNAGTFTNNGTKALLYTGVGSTEIKGGTFTGPKIEQSTGAPAIYGGSFSQAVPEEYCADGFIPKDNGNGTYGVKTGSYVAQVGSTKYENLQDALDVVPDGGTVTVLKDITTSGNIFADGYVSGGNRTYIVDLGGYTVSGATFIVDSGNNVTFKNGTIESATYGIQNKATAIVDSTATVKSTATDASAVFGAEGSTTNINGTVEGNKYGVIARGGTLNVAGKVTAVNTGIDAIDGGIANINDGADVSGKFAIVAHKNSTVNVNGGKVEGTSHAVSGNGTAADGPYTINVTGGTLTATNGAAIYNPNATGTMNISGGTITGSTIAVAAGTNSTNSISGGTFSSAVPEEYCATGFQPKDNGNGTYTVEVKDDVLTPVLTKESDGNQFNLGNLEYHFGTLLGVQKKNAVAGAEKTSENEAQENGNDLRFVAVLKTDILRNAQDYGFVLAKVNSSKTTESVAPNINALSADGVGNGEKVISAKGSSNTICGDYGEFGTDTSYKYITCAVNSVEDGTKVVARFYVKIGGKTYYAQYPKGGNYDANFTAAVAGVDANGVVY